MNALTSAVPLPMRLATDWFDYMIDALQRSIIFLDLVRQRGEAEFAITSGPFTTGLHFDHEILLRGETLPRPINYSLLRIVPPAGFVCDPCKRPIVVVDARAGQGTGNGTGGVAAEREIGDALRAGHPVYFISRAAIPGPGQQFLDVVAGQVAFFDLVVQRHPKAPLPFALGNCRAAYQILMVAMLRPDLFGPCLVAGVPLSFWQGQHGKTPLRYSVGLLGGSWLTAMMSDLGGGKIGGIASGMNFDSLDPADAPWRRQYQNTTTIDTDAARDLACGAWRGDFTACNGDELLFLVENLFVGDFLSRNQLRSHDGTIFDLRSITSPIIVFTSTRGNISRPPQTLGWIADLYRDVDDIRAAGQTIVYCLNREVGPLALFVPNEVGARDDEAFVWPVDIVECLPPGLYEMIVFPRPPGESAPGVVTGDWSTRFEARSVAEICALGRNSPADDRAFAAAARLSSLNLAAYRFFLQPLLRAACNPLRLGYAMFADSNPWLAGVEHLAAGVATVRWSVPPDNLFLALQAGMSNRIMAALDAYRASRDRMAEQAFFGFYGSPLVQALLGLDPDSDGRPPPGPGPDNRAAENQDDTEAYRPADTASGGFDEALVRAVLFVVAAGNAIDQRSACALNAACQQIRPASLAAFKLMVRAQFLALQRDPAQSVAVLGTLVPTPEARRNLLAQADTITRASGVPTAGDAGRLAWLSQLLQMPEETPCARNDTSEPEVSAPVTAAKDHDTGTMPAHSDHNDPPPPPAPRAARRPRKRAKRPTA